MCLELHELDPARFLTAAGLAWQAALRKVKVKVDLWTNIDILLIVEKGMRGRICHAIHQCAETNKKYMKNYGRNNESLYLKCLDVNNFCVWAMSQKLPLVGFKWVEETSQFNEDFVKRL